MTPDEPGRAGRWWTLQSFVDAVVSLHVQEVDSLRDESVTGFCAECGNRWPCPTLRVMRRTNAEEAS